MKLRNVLLKATSLFALALVVLNVNATCICVMHQPKLPEAAMRFKRP